MAEQVFKKEAESFYYSEQYGPTNTRNDYVAEDELTVTITLHEYRQMLWSLAKHGESIREKEEEARKARMERDELKKKLDAVIEKIGYVDTVPLDVYDANGGA